MVNRHSVFNCFDFFLCDLILFSLLCHPHYLGNFDLPTSPTFGFNVYGVNYGNLDLIY